MTDNPDSVTNILRPINSSHHRRLASTTIHVLTFIISNEHESNLNRMRACHILGTSLISNFFYCPVIMLSFVGSLVADDNDRCNDAWKSGALVKLSDLFKSITPPSKPQEWDDGEPLGVSQLREVSSIHLSRLYVVLRMDKK